jgi:hypothetical protein
MKKRLALALVLFLTSCADSKRLPGNGSDREVVEPYGFLNEDTTRLDCVDYEPSIGNVIWGIILIETIVVPLYINLFSIYEPVSVDNDCVKE